MKTLFLLLAIALSSNYFSYAQRNPGSGREPASDRIDRVGGGNNNRNPEIIREPIKTPIHETPPNPTPYYPPSNHNPSPNYPPPHHPIDPPGCLIYEPPQHIILVPVPEPTLKELPLPEVFEIGLNKFNSEKYEEAIDCFNILIENDPLDSSLYVLRGRAFHNLEIFDRAKKDYFIAIKISPIYADAYYYLALTELRLDEQENAIKNFSLAAELGNKNAANILKKYFK
jgi:tetratricopeptide (TPR) repeat protein